MAIPPGAAAENPNKAKAHTDGSDIHVGEKGAGETHDRFAQQAFAYEGSFKDALALMRGQDAGTRPLGQDGALPGHKDEHLKNDGTKVELTKGDATVDLKRDGKGESYKNPQGEMALRDGKIDVDTKSGEHLRIDQREVDQRLGDISLRYQRDKDHPLSDTPPGGIDSKIDKHGHTKLVAHGNDGLTIEAKQAANPSDPTEPSSTYKVTDNSTGQPKTTTYQYTEGSGWTSTDDKGNTTKIDTSKGNYSIGDSTYLTPEGKIVTQLGNKTVELHAHPDHAHAKIGDPTNPDAKITAKGTETTTTTGAGTPTSPETATRVQTNPSAPGPAVLEVSGTQQQVQDKLTAAQTGQPIQMGASDFALTANGRGGFNAQMGPGDQGAVFQVGCNADGGFDYQSGNFFGDIQSTDPYGSLLSTDFANSWSYTPDTNSITSSSSSSDYTDPQTIAAASASYDQTNKTAENTDIALSFQDLGIAGLAIAAPDAPSINYGIEIATTSIQLAEAAKSAALGSVNGPYIPGPVQDFLNRVDAEKGIANERIAQARAKLDQSQTRKDATSGKASDGYELPPLSVA
jgi:hypothetical protein